MENNPLVSIIMNCYNSDEFLEEAIESILNQTYQNLEIIFWDNQSTDNSAKIVKSYKDNRIKYFYSSIFTPLGEARNLAIDKTDGEWIAFLDCDDLWNRDKLKISFIELEKYNNRNNVSLIYSQTEIIDSNNNITNKVNKSISGDIHNILLTEGDFIIFSSIIVKKNILIKRGKIDKTLKYCEDYDLLLKITKGYQAIGMNKYLTSYRVHSSNITSKKYYENNIEVIEFLNNYIEINNIYEKTIKYNIFLNNSYRVAYLIYKLLSHKEFQKIVSLVIKYPLYIISSPYAIICRKLKI